MFLLTNIHFFALHLFSIPPLAILPFFAYNFLSFHPAVLLMHPFRLTQ